MKIFKPIYAALYTSIFLGFSQIIFLFFFLKDYKIHYLEWVFIFLFITFLTFSTFYLVLQKFIYKKIKLIYKSIRTIKGNTPHNKNSNLLMQVEKEVKAWKKEKLQELEELKKMEKFRKEYVGNVSHELKTPIFNIQGYLESLLDMKDRSSEIFDRFLQKAFENTERLNTIVMDLEMISKNETEGLNLYKSFFNIKELILQIFDEFEIIAQKHNVKLLLKQGKCPDYIVYADKERIHQVLTNLISNAIKYNRDFGKVRVSCYDMDDHILIEVTDTGIGIKQKHLPRLFERFYRVDKNRSRKKGGSGLGLAIVKHILEAHKQMVHVRSSIGIGTTFGFTLEKAKKK